MPTDASSTVVETTPPATESAKDETSSQPTATDLEALKKVLPNLTADTLAQLLEGNPDILKQATSTIRRRDIDKKAEEIAQQKAADQVKGIQAELELTRKQYTELIAKLETDQLAHMTDEERELHVLKKALETERANSARANQSLSEREEAEAKDEILRHASTEYGLDDDDLKEAKKQDNPVKMWDEVLKAAGKKLQSERKGKKDLEERLAALERASSGQSTFAATGSSASGGDAMTYDDIAARYVKDPKTWEKKYREARNKRQWY